MRESSKHRESRKENPHCEDFDYREDRSRASLAPLGHVRLGIGIQCRIEAMKQKAHHRLDYPVPRSVHLVEETLRPETHLRQQSNLSIKVQSLRLINAVMVC